MTEELRASFDNALDLLRRWHDQRQPEVGRAVLRFIESELRLMTPALVTRSWPEDLVEDALRDFLVWLVEHRLRDDINDARKYLGRAFRNHCIDCYRARARKRETSFEAGAGEWESPAESSVSPLDGILREEQSARVQAALVHLSPADRVILKLELAPVWLPPGGTLVMEIRWSLRGCKLASSTTHSSGEIASSASRESPARRGSTRPAVSAPAVALTRGANSPCRVFIHQRRCRSELPSIEHHIREAAPRNARSR